MSLRPANKGVKRFVCAAVLNLLGRSFRSLSSKDSPVKEETDNWPENIVVVVAASPSGPYLCLKKTPGTVAYAGNVRAEDAGLFIEFKSIESGFRALTGLLSIHGAFAEHRFTLKGDIFFGMSVVRCLYIIEAALFPWFYAKRIIKRRPPKVGRWKAYSGLFGSGGAKKGEISNAR
jgi:hypothetical protein